MVSCRPPFDIKLSHILVSVLIHPFPIPFPLISSKPSLIHKTLNLPIYLYIIPFSIHHIFSEITFIIYFDHILLPFLSLQHHIFTNPFHLPILNFSTIIISIFLIIFPINLPSTLIIPI